MTQLGWIILGCYLALINILLFALMGIDKGLAKKNRHRVPERTLFLLAFLGGALGGILGMTLFRHKTQHRKFLIGFPLILVLNLAIVFGIVYLANHLQVSLNH